MSVISSEQALCRLCLNIINDTNFEVIEDIIKGILQVVLPHLDLKTNDKYTMCRTCHVNLISAYNFKSMCIDTEDAIISYINPEEQMPTVKLEDVYLKHKGNVNLTDILDNQRICRLCMQLIMYGFVSLNQVDVDIMVNYVPEVDINTTKDPVICGLCFDSLCTLGSFVKNWLEAHEQYMQSYIKAEEIDFKSEESDQDSDSSSHDLFEGTIKNYEKKYVSEDTFEIKVETSLDALPPSKVQVNNCGANNYESKLHEDPLIIEMYQCDVCSFKTKYKRSLKLHQLLHKNPLDIRMYKCRICSYITKHKHYLKQHKLKHKDPSKIPMYRCDVCGYNTRYKPYLKRHQLMHKDPSEIQMYNCDACSFETKYRGCLKRHQILHKEPAKIYKCDMCNFETRRKTDLTRHQLMPKDISEIQMYQCDACSFETKYKTCLRKHQILHKKPAKMYKCDVCNFETRRKTDLKHHQLMHKDPSEVQMDKCDV